MEIERKNNMEGKEGFWKTLKKPHNVVLWVLGIVVLLIVAAISELSGGGGIVTVIGNSMKTVATEIGFALLIAAFLSASIEESTRRQFHTEIDSRITEVQKNVFRSTYSRSLPDQFFNEVEELLFRCKFSYTNYHIEYDFSWQKPSVENSLVPLMNVDIRHLFSIRNMTAFASEHCIRLQTQELLSLNDASCPRVMTVILRGHGTHGTFEPEQIESINNEAESGNGIKTFQIQTESVPPGESIEVEIVVQSMQFADGFAFCRCLAPSNGLTVTAKFPPEIGSDSVGVDTAHRITCKRIPLGYDGNKFSWSIAGAVLPSQGINFWWRQVSED